MSPEVVLEFEGGYMRPLKPEDIHPDYISGLNDPGVNRYLDGVKHTRQTEQSVIDFVLHNQKSDNAVLFGIWLTGGAHHSGTARLHGVEYSHKTAHIGVCLFDKSAWGMHVGSKAIAAATQWAFDVVGLRWIEAGAYADNIASQKSFLAAGYDWIYDIPGKYILDGKPTRVMVFAARNAER